MIFYKLTPFFIVSGHDATYHLLNDQQNIMPSSCSGGTNHVDMNERVTRQSHVSSVLRSYHNTEIMC